MQVAWVPELLRVRTATDRDAGPAAPSPDPGVPAAPPSKDGAKAKAPRPLLRGLEIPRENEKPILVYFHWPHEDGARGKQVVKFCSGPMDDEAFVRVSPLYLCVEINTKDSEPRLVEEAKVTGTPAVLVCDPEGGIVWRTDDTGLSGKALAAALRRVLQEEFPARWAEVEKEMKFQRETISGARRLLAARKTEEAVRDLGLIIDSEVRFTEEWTEARRLLKEAEKKAEEAEGR